MDCQRRWKWSKYFAGMALLFLRSYTHLIVCLFLCCICLVSKRRMDQMKKVPAVFICMDRSILFPEAGKVVNSDSLYDQKNMF